MKQLIWRAIAPSSRNVYEFYFDSEEDQWYELISGEYVPISKEHIFTNARSVVHPNAFAIWQVEWLFTNS